MKTLLRIALFFGLRQPVIKYLDAQGLYIDITPEFYQDGINWNWQIWWYTPKGEWIWRDYTNPSDGKYPEHHSMVAGTMMYGDNGEYPTRVISEKAAIDMAVQLLVVAEVREATYSEIVKKMRKVICEEMDAKKDFEK